MKRTALVLFLTLLVVFGPATSTATTHYRPTYYEDKRPTGYRRMPVRDVGPIFQHGLAPDGCDQMGAREAIPFRVGNTLYMHYDGQGPTGWTTCLATSQDGLIWQRRGTVLGLGAPGTPDSGSASSPWVVEHDGRWHMYYLGTPNTGPAPDRVPADPYLTLYARSDNPGGPWTKDYSVVPFRPQPGTWRASSSSPGHIIRHNGEWLQFFSGGAPGVSNDGQTRPQRTIGIARTTDLTQPWRVDPNPIFPPGIQVENSSIYYEPTNGHYFLFTNHVGIKNGVEYTDAIWVFWTKDPNVWKMRNRGVVLDSRNCTWAKGAIGMPTVIPDGNRLLMFYDGVNGTGIGHMNRDIGLATIDMPIQKAGKVGATQH